MTTASSTSLNEAVSSEVLQNLLRCVALVRGDPKLTGDNEQTLLVWLAHASPSRLHAALGDPSPDWLCVADQATVAAFLLSNLGEFKDHYIARSERPDYKGAVQLELKALKVLLRWKTTIDRAAIRARLEANATDEELIARLKDRNAVPRGQVELAESVLARLDISDELRRAAQAVLNQR